MTKPWEFWIDIGGTFTDCIARSPDDRLTTKKVLSSGVTKGRVEERLTDNQQIRTSRIDDPPDIWVGYEIRFLDAKGSVLSTTTVNGFDHRTGTISLAEPLPASTGQGTPFEFDAHEEAPIVAIRQVLGLRLEEVIPLIVVKLGTTRGTNALLTRQGARTAFVTTKGFADVLLIANQDRPLPTSTRQGGLTGASAGAPPRPQYVR